MKILQFWLIVDLVAFPLRIALAVAKGIKISKNVKLYSYKDDNLTDFKLENIEVLIDKNLIEKNLIKPLYLS